MTKKLKRTFALVRGTIAFIRLLRDPKQLDKVIEISQQLAEPEILRKIGQRAASRSNEAERALIERPRLDLSYVLKNKDQLHPHSLGACYLKFLNDRGLNPNDLPILPGKNADEFVQAHLIETHDLWHVVCGFDTDEAGELGLQAVYLSQLNTSLSGILIGGGFLNSALKKPEETERRMQEIIRGWNMGQKAKPLFGIPWNQLWNTPLEEIRMRYAIN